MIPRTKYAWAVEVYDAVVHHVQLCSCCSPCAAVTHLSLMFMFCFVMNCSGLRASIASCSKDDVLVVLVAQHVLGLYRLLCRLLRLCLCVGRLCRLLLLSYGLLGGSVSLLLRGHLLQAVELLAVQLVELRVDVLDGVLGARNDDVLAGAC